MDGRCVDCRWWDRDEEAYEDDPTRPCRLTRTGSRWIGRESDKRLHLPTLAAAYDAEGYDAVLYTAPDFGCVQFAAREGSDD